MIKSKQLQVGNDAERFVKEIFKNFGFWAYNTPKSKDGSQPVDIVAMKNNINWLLDVKHVRTEEISFDFSRIEANQLTCMDYARNFAGIQELGFAIVFERKNCCYYMTFDKYLSLKKEGRKSVRFDELLTLEEYINDRS